MKKKVDTVVDPVDEALKLIQSKPEGILQSELWKELGVDSRKCSRIVKKLEDSGLIDQDRVQERRDQDIPSACQTDAGESRVTCLPEMS